MTTHGKYILPDGEIFVEKKLVKPEITSDSITPLLLVSWWDDIE